MQNQMETPQPKGNIAAVVTFILVVGVIMIIALMNAPTAAGFRVMSSLNNYLGEVRKTALPFLFVVGIGALIVGLAAAVMVRREWPHPQKRATLLAGYGFLLPYILITLLFTIGVVLFTLYISFTQYDIFSAPVWVGLQNYIKAFSGITSPINKDFIQSLYNVIWYTIIVVPLETAAAIALAVLLNNPMRFRDFFRMIFYAPSVTSSVVITLIFMWFYLNTGYINFFLSSFLGIFGVHWQNISWLNDPRGLIEVILAPFGVHFSYAQWYLKGPSIAWMAIMFQNIFTTAPTFMIMFLAALQDINPTLYEAAEIDGANRWNIFWQITLPLLRPIILLVVVLGTIGALQVFDQVYLATQGGPLGTSTTPVYLTFSEALGTNGQIQMGYAAALAFILAVLIFGFTYIQRRFLESGTQMY